MPEPPPPPPGRRAPQPPKAPSASRIPGRTVRAPPRRVAAVALETDFKRECDESSATLQLAESLFVELVVRQHGEAAAPSATRTAVSCLLLEQICAIFARYHSVLGVVAETIMRSVYVPNTPEMRELLKSTSAPLTLPAVLSEEARQMLAPYARKTYFQAYEEISDALARYARNNRSIEIRLSRQTKVFDHTMKHWMASIQRNFFVAWRSYSKRRLQLRAKYRAIFYRVRSDECKVKAIRRWRERAARIKKAAMLDAASADELQALNVSVVHMQEQVATLTEYNANLSKQISEQEGRRQTLQSEIDERERLVAEMQTRAGEVERLGAELLDSVFFSVLPPDGATPIDVLINWAHGVIEATGGSIDGAVGPLRPLLEDEYVVDVSLSAVGCVMMGFAGDRAPTRESVVQLHLDNENGAGTVVAMFERLTGRTCIVSDEQIATGQRGVLLLLLGSLMRFATQWLQCPQPAPAGAHALRPSKLNASDYSARVGIQQKWILGAIAAQNAALAVAVQHPVALSYEESEDQPHFLELPAHAIADILPLHQADRRHLVLMKACRKVYGDIRQLYIAYATPTLTFSDLLRLLKDCYMVGDRKLPKKQVEAICRATWRHSADERHEDGIGSVEISKLQFTEIILRVCHAELKRNDPDVTELLAPHVLELVSDNLAAHALRSDIDKFKQVVRHPHAQAVVARHRIALRRVFRKYANCDDGESMNRVGFQAMARDCEWITRTVSLEAVNDVFRRVQNAEAGSVESLDLTEWLECLCAMSVYHNPSPFVPLAAKLAAFVEERVLGALIV